MPADEPADGLQWPEGRRTEGSTDSTKVHQRANSNPERISNVSYLENTDYGIRLVGRTAKDDEAILSQSMIDRVPAGLAIAVLILL